MSDVLVTEVVLVDPEDLEEAHRLAKEYGIEIREPGVSPLAFPLFAIPLIFLGAAAAVGAVVYLLDKAKGGQVIDLTKTTPKEMFYRSKDIIYGLIVIIAKDGKVTVEVKEPKGMFGGVIDALKDIVVGMGTATIEAIAGAAKKAVGDKADIKAVPAAA